MLLDWVSCSEDWFFFESLTILLESNYLLRANSKAYSASGEVHAKNFLNFYSISLHLILYSNLLLSNLLKLIFSVISHILPYSSPTFQKLSSS